MRLIDLSRVLSDSLMRLIDLSMVLSDSFMRLIDRSMILSDSLMRLIDLSMVLSDSFMRLTDLFAVPIDSFTCVIDLFRILTDSLARPNMSPYRYSVFSEAFIPEVIADLSAEFVQPSISRTRKDTFSLTRWPRIAGDRRVRAPGRLIPENFELAPTSLLPIKDATLRFVIWRPRFGSFPGSDVSLSFAPIYDRPRVAWLTAPPSKPNGLVL